MKDKTKKIKDKIELDTILTWLIYLTLIIVFLWEIKTLSRIITYSFTCII